MKISNIKILTVLGARPQFIKAAALSKALALFPRIEERIMHSGQHYDNNMSQVFFDEMQIQKPYYHHSIKSKSLTSIMAEMMIAIEEAVNDFKPDYILVFGDTNTTLAGALVASKMKVELIHIEAGLRSYNRAMPEEVNRVIVDQLSKMLFVPSENSVENLKKEGIRENIFIVGDIMLDAFLHYCNYAKAPNISLPDKYYLATIHRQENADSFKNLSDIAKGLELLNYEVVLPLHPRTLANLENFNIKLPSNIYVVEPLGYFNMLFLILNCEGVLTDSGGLQKEAYFAGKPLGILRNETEWTELLDNNSAVLLGTDSAKISRFMQFNLSGNDKHVYGNGKAGSLIAEKIIELYDSSR